MARRVLCSLLIGSGYCFGDDWYLKLKGISINLERKTVRNRIGAQEHEVELSTVVTSIPYGKRKEDTVSGCLISYQAVWMMVYS